MARALSFIWLCAMVLRASPFLLMSCTTRQQTPTTNTRVHYRSFMKLSALSIVLRTVSAKCLDRSPLVRETLPYDKPSHDAAFVHLVRTCPSIPAEPQTSNAAQTPGLQTIHCFQINMRLCARALAISSICCRCQSDRFLFTQIHTLSFHIPKVTAWYTHIQHGPQRQDL